MPVAVDKLPGGGCVRVERGHQCYRTRSYSWWKISSSGTQYTCSDTPTAPVGRS